MNWVVKKFDDLSASELYAILQLRNEVFIVEQHCPYQDLDDKDQKSIHFMCWKQDKLVAYTRLVPAGVFYEEPSIGRVVTSQLIRRNGMGRELMLRSIDEAYKLFGKRNIRIGAQLYLKKFYESLGFVQVSEMYLEDGIEHIEMLLSYE